jgi:competence protein ComEC
MILVGATFLWRSRAMVITALLAGILFGLWRGSLERVELAKYQQFIGTSVVIQGKISEDVERGNSNEMRLKLQDIMIANIKLPGELWASASSRIEIKRSDIVTLGGKLREGFGNFPASMSFAKVIKAERPDGADVARDMRDGFASGVRRAITEPMASLGVGYLTGQRSTLPPELDEQLKIAGLTHVVVASGYNLTILVRFARRVFARFSKYASTMLAAAMIVGFVLVTGFSPSMSRAAAVTGLSLATWYYGRAVHPLVLLPFVAAITLALNPLFLWGDIGWYLSFAAFTGVMLLSPMVHEHFWGKKKAGMVRQIVVDTSCAQMVTMPIIAFSFGSYAPYALLANLLVLPLIPLAMALTFVAGITGLLFAGVASVVGKPAEVLLGYMVGVAQWVADLPGAQGEVVFGVELLAGSYVVIMAFALFLWRRTGHNFRGDSMIE